MAVYAPFSYSSLYLCMHFFSLFRLEYDWSIICFESYRTQQVDPISLKISTHIQFPPRLFATLSLCALSFAYFIIINLPLFAPLYIYTTSYLTSFSLIRNTWWSKKTKIIQKRWHFFRKKEENLGAILVKLVFSSL